ncbi:MAG: hypothetical protein NVS1B11_19180 [Terriglobales bacterium]
MVISGAACYLVDERVNVNPDIHPYASLIQITLRFRGLRNKMVRLGPGHPVANPYLVDSADYNKRFPKKALKEYKRWVDAERKGEHDKAIAYYLSVLKMAPDYYPAHNTSGFYISAKRILNRRRNSFRKCSALSE